MNARRHSALADGEQADGKTGRANSNCLSRLPVFLWTDPTPFLCAFGLWLFALGCDPQADSIARAATLTAPHLQTFAQFDRWARRAGVSEAVMQNRAALSEAMFAPIRRTASVAAAWVQLERERGFTLSLPANTQPPSNVKWVSLRDPQLGALRAARLSHCASALSARVFVEQDASCVLISRSAATPPVGALIVTLAFREAAAAGAR